MAWSEDNPLVVGVMDDYQQVAARFGPWSSLPVPAVVRSVDCHIDDIHDLARALEGCAVVVAMRERTPVTAALLSLLDDLQLLVTTGPSNAALDVAAAHARGVVVSGTGGYLTPTSELTWALILALLRHIPAEDASVRSGEWQHTMGAELSGRRLGIVGLGRLGALVARVGLAFDMDVVAWSPNLTAQRCDGVGVTQVDRHELFSTADVVSIHMVLSDRSRGLVGRDELDLMKPTAILVNTSRGPIVDEDALITALQTGVIAGAGLDVFDVEPLPSEHPFRQLPNTVLTPHIGYVTDGLYQQFYREIVEDVGAWLSGTPIRLILP
jgi:phosphoglycerate dehydrogenase-like enzyme